MKTAEIQKNIGKHYLKELFIVLIFGGILFASSGDFTWIWAWIYILTYLVYSLVNAFLLPKELLAERGKKKENVKNWDKTLTRLGAIPGIAVIVIAGLDYRFLWTSDLGLTIHLVGFGFYLLGDIIVSWSMASNKFFSTLVRIQEDRLHQVASSGPYKIVRHPGYVGILLNTISTPFIFGSFWALIPAFIVAVLFVIRTVFEDHTLQIELAGYKTYSENVSYRLIPGIW